MSERVDEAAAPSSPSARRPREATVIAFPTSTRVDQAPQSDEPRLRELIGDVLRDERLSQGRTLREVAEEAAVSLPYLSEVERGRKEVSSDVLDAIHRALDLELAEVLERATRRLRVGPQRFDAPTLLAA